MRISDPSTPLSERKVLRRGLLSGIAALSAAAALKITGKARLAEAANGGPMLIGATNLEEIAQRTFLVANPPISGNPTFIAYNGSGPFSMIGSDGLQGITEATGGLAAGVHGHNEASSGQTFGVYGTTTSSSGTGVYGTSLGLGVPIPATAAGAGVYGAGSANGVFGKATSGIGVQGQSTSSYGVYGACLGSSVGVLGAGTNGPGVWGQSANNVGVLGLSPGNAPGVYGISQAGGTGVFGESVGGVGVFALSHAPFVPALYAQSSAGSGQFAGRFDGNVLINGNYVATGTKSAIVPHPDGTMRTMYAQESPEAWFEDFGRARLTAGVARITLDAEFTALVQQHDYYVFLTPEGESDSLYVSQLNPTSFEVRERNGGKSAISFAYRVVARRKDVPAARLQRVDPRTIAKINIEPVKHSPVVLPPAEIGAGQGSGAPGQKIPAQSR